MSTLKVNTIQDASGNNGTTPALLYNGTAKAWVNFNGTGTPAIRASYNVTSLTDNGTGDWTVTFTNAFADANYAPVCQSGNSSANGPLGLRQVVSMTTSAIRCLWTSSTATAADNDQVWFAVFR